MEGDKDKDWDHDRRREMRRSPSSYPGRAARFKSYTSRSRNRKRSHSRERRGIQDAHQRSSILVAAKKRADVSETFADVKLGIAGCNKIENPSYMDGGDNRKEEKIPGDKDYIPGNYYLTLLERTRSSAKNMVAVYDQQVDMLKKSLESSEEYIKLQSKVLDDLDKEGLKSRVGDVLYDSIFRAPISRFEKHLSTAKNVFIHEKQSFDIKKETFENFKKGQEEMIKYVDDTKKRLFKI